MLNIEKVSKTLEIIGVRTKIKEFKGYADYGKDIEFYQLVNGKMIVVFWELGTIKSILRQRVKNKRYCYQLNGQDGTNTEQIYCAEYDYEHSEYIDILAS